MMIPARQQEEMYSKGISIPGVVKEPDVDSKTNLIWFQNFRSCSIALRKPIEKSLF